MTGSDDHNYTIAYLGAAGDLRHQELHLLVDQLALLPGDGLTALLPCPHLVALGVLLPQSHAVLLGHVPTLRDLQTSTNIAGLFPHTAYCDCVTDLFDVRDCLLSLHTALLHKELGCQLSLAVGLLLHAEAALRVGNNLALSLHHLDADILSLLLALLDELSLAGLALHLHPLERLVG